MMLVRFSPDVFDKILLVSKKLKKWHWIVLALFGFLFACYLYITRGYDTDYSDTQWITVEGKKYSNFRPEIQMKYVTNRDVPGCGSRGNWKTFFLGFPPQYKQTYFGEESDDGKYYRIKFPRNFRVRHCAYNSGGAKLYMEEKSDDPRLVNDPEYVRGTAKRSNLVTGNKITTLLFRSNQSIDTLDKSANFIDENNLDVFCYKVSFFADKYYGNIQDIYCSTAYESEKPSMFAYYSPNFLQQNSAIHINLKVSNQTYCRPLNDTDCNEEGEKDLPQIPRNFRYTIKPDWFTPFNEEDNPNAR